MPVNGMLDEGPMIGTLPNRSQCMKKFVKNDRTSTKKLLDMVMNKVHTKFQSLNISNIAPWGVNSIRAEGSFRLDTVYTEGSDTFAGQSSINLPFYAFRLGVPNGFSVYGFNSRSHAYPIVSYRLFARRASSASAWIYGWNKVEPMNDTLANGFPAFGNIPVAYNTYTDSNQVMSTTEYRHNTSNVNLWLNLPTQRNCAVRTGICKFTDEIFCPPDEAIFADASGNPVYPTNMATFKTNSGSYLKSVPPYPLLPDGLDTLESTTAWNQFWQSFEGHPLRKNTQHPAPRTVFQRFMKWDRVFTPNTTMTADSGPRTHMHRLIYSPHWWKKTAIQDGLDPAGVTHPGPGNNHRMIQTNLQQDVGIFPENPKDQRWFVVYASANIGAQPFGYTVSNNTSATFDISIEDKFSYIIDWNYPVPPVVPPLALMGPVDEALEGVAEGIGEGFEPIEEEKEEA